MNWIHETLIELKLLQEKINQQARLYALTGGEQNKIAYIEILCETSLYLDEIRCRCQDDIQYRLLNLKRTIDKKIDSLI